MKRWIASTLPFLLASTASAAGAPPITGLVQIDLGGRSLFQYPHFEHVQSFYEGTPLEAGVDTTRWPRLNGRTVELFVVVHKNAEEWALEPLLIDDRGASQTVSFVPGGITPNTFTLDPGLLNGWAGEDIGRGYDIVLDMDGNGALSSGDWIDGGTDEAGIYVLRPMQDAGPYFAFERIYSGGSQLQQKLYFPHSIYNLVDVPIVVISHGNGHNYLWYDHLGRHLASWGYVVMSHFNNTGPGIESASTTTLTNTDYLLGNLATIADGALLGRVDTHRIVWMGHSRGGEGITRAYDRIFDGTYTPTNYVLSDLRLLSSIAPTDFLGNASANPHGVNYHLWTGGADADVNGCADCNLCQTFHLHERASGARQSISLHGAGHGAFHNGDASLVAAGPCQLSRVDTHAIMKAYVLPLLKRYTHQSVGAEECLWRQFESFRSPNLPATACAVVDLLYQRAPAGKWVVDDFQSNPATSLASSGSTVTTDLADLAEGRFDDPSSVFTNNAAEVMNGMTLSGGVADTTAGATFSWNGSDQVLTYDLAGGALDVRSWRYLSFRAAQTTRHPLTTAVLGDLVFSVRVRDTNGRQATIRLDSYGGGIEEPYQRTGCGTGVGWANEWETIRIRVEDFTRDGNRLDLRNVAAVEFLFGPSYGSLQGRIGFDELEFTN